jgi:uncharacterized damage-inducible protein DinB
MKLAEHFLGQLERETSGTRRVLERVPEGRNDWKPHPKSMPLGYLAALVARMPSWVAMMVNLDEYVLEPQGKFYPKIANSNSELLKMFDDSVAESRDALSKTSDEHLLTPWRLIVGGHVVSEQPRYAAISDAVFSHLSHHRGQLTVYLRLNDVPVPAIFGPTADEGQFG